MKRLQVPSWLLVILVCAAMTLDLRAVEPGFRKGWIVILHTNDLSGHLTGWRGWD